MLLCPHCKRPAKLPALVESDLHKFIGASVQTTCCGRHFSLAQQFVLTQEKVSGKVIIAGSRTMPVADYWKIQEAVHKSGYTIQEVVCGMAKGADQLGGKWAWERKIPVKSFPAKWDEYGKQAGFKRNLEMAYYADAAIIFIYEDSGGSRDMEKKMRSLKKPVFTVIDGEIDYAF